MGEIMPGEVMPERVSQLLRQALISHGMDPDAPEIVAEIHRVMSIMLRVDVTPNCPLCHEPPAFAIGDTAMCGNEECKTIFWDRTKTLDELLFNMGLVELRQSPPGSGSPFNEFKDEPDS
jgi:hypothetical protein